MSEDNERNLENAVPEAAEEQKDQSAAEDSAREAAPADVRGEAAPEGEEPKEEREKRAAASGRDRRKKGKRRSVIPALVIALVAVLVVFGVLVGYGLGRVRSQRGEQEAEALPTAEAASQEEAPAYNAFDEELTMENQQALDALSGEPAPMDEGASALLGEDAFFEEGLTEEAPAGESVVVAEFGDGEQLMSDEVRERYNEELASYIMEDGFSEEEVSEMLLDDVLHTMVSERVLIRHAQEMGIYELTDEDRAQIDAQAEELYGESVDYCLRRIDTQGMSEEEARAAAEASLLESEGVTLDTVRSELESTWWEQKLYQQITAGVTVDEADVQTLYDQRLEEQRASFTEYPADYEFSQRSGEIILYNPAGYRAVKMLLFGFDDAEAEMAVFALTDEFYTIEEEDGASAQDRQAELDAYYAGPEARAQQALEALRGGADMDEMILSEGWDEGMRDDQLRAHGYYVCADSTLWNEEFVAAAMALENVGDYSEPVRTDEGVCILQYLGEVPEGEVPLSDVHDALEEEALNMARGEAYLAQTEAWVEEANPSYYPERMQ